MAMCLLGFTAIAHDIYHLLGGKDYSVQLFLSISLSSVLGFYFWQVHAETLGSHFGQSLPGLQKVQNIHNIGGGILASLTAAIFYKVTGGEAPIAPVFALCAMSFSCNFGNDASKRDDTRSVWFWFLVAAYMALLLGGISLLDTLTKTYPATATFIALAITVQHYRILLRKENIRARNAQGVQGLGDLSRQYRAKGTILEPKLISIPEIKPQEKRLDFIIRCAWFERFGGSRFHLRSMIFLSLLSAVVCGWGGALLWSGIEGIREYGIINVIRDQIINGKHGYMLAYLTMLAVTAMSFLGLPRMQTSIIYPLESSEKHYIMQRAMRQTWFTLHLYLFIILLAFPAIFLWENTLWADNRPSYSLILFLLSLGLMPFAQKLAVLKAEKWGVFDGLAVKTTFFAIWFVFLIAFSLSTTFAALGLNYIARENIADSKILIPLLLFLMLSLHQLRLFDGRFFRGNPRET